jgi:para-aminobenzoate synthetase component 1
MKVQDLTIFKQKAAVWANSFDVCCYLDSNGYSDKYGKYDFLLAVGVKKEITCSTATAFEEWKSFYDEHKNWMFGFLGYDLKNGIEDLESQNPDQLAFPDLYFFIPEYLLIGEAGEVHVLLGKEGILNDIDQTQISHPESLNSIIIQPKLAKETYLSAVVQMKEHILRGDIYEANLCQEFFATHAIINPLSVYQSLKTLSATPFSGYFKLYDNYILSATPERFLCKRGEKLISQPIKGTSKRAIDPVQDELSRNQLKNSRKEQAENVMIVDLVRNDLSKSAVKGTVKVDELFGIYAFPQVFQMISTISCTLNPDLHFIDAIRNAFPMGSMTGAPKLRAMELIEQMEQTKRGIYSGALGYIEPGGDFDFNVVIRSLLYNAENKYLSFQVGSAITYEADPVQEYEECLLKASAILETISKKNATRR